MLATPLTTAVSVTLSFDKKFIYSVAECLYNHIKPEVFQTRAPTSLQRQVRGESNKRGNGTGLGAHAILQSSIAA